MIIRRHTPVKLESVEPHLCTTTARLQILGSVPFFKGLAEADLIKVNDMFHQKDFATGDTIYFSGDPADHIYVIAEGRVKLLNQSLTGKEILLDLLTPGEFFGSIAGLGEDTNSETAQALTSSCVLVINRDAFRQIISWHPEVAVKVIDIMAGRLQEANKRVQLLTDLPVEGRIAYMLLKLAKKLGQKRSVGLLLQVPLTRENLASMTSTTPESASRAISQFKKDGLIRSGRGWVALTDVEGLMSIAGIEE